MIIDKPDRDGLHAVTFQSRAFSGAIIEINPSRSPLRLEIRHTGTVMGAIKEKMKRDMEIGGLSKRTQESYLGCIKQFIKYQYVSALKFLYGQTLKRDWKIDMIPYHKRSKRLPVMLNREEVVRMYKTVPYLKHKAMILTLYSTGIRASELARVKVSDIDSKRMLIRIDQGKNRKDRHVRLP